MLEIERYSLSRISGVKGWMHVLFSDEKIFLGDGFMGQVWVRRPRGEANNPDYQVHKKAHPVQVNVWGCFCGRGLGYIHIFNEKMDGKLLRKILDKNVIPAAYLYYKQHPPEQWYLQHDNDKKFTGQVVQTWLHNHGITCIDFPPYSPDLNPIEHIWADMARRVEMRPASTMEQLQDVVAEEWERTSLELLTKLIESMPRRLQAVIDAQGGYTSY